MQIRFQSGKKPRNELFLPPLRYVVADDWIDKLGLEAFCAWLKMHSWVDRRDVNREHDKVPYTMTELAKKLGVSRTKLYTKIIRPLWNYGLIDLVEFEESEQLGTKPVNVIVYTCPFNQHSKEIEPLEKLRDFDTEYQTPIREIALKGGRPKKYNPETGVPLNDESEDPKNPEKENGGSDCFNSETGGEHPFGVFQNQNRGCFDFKTGGVSKLKHNNTTNKYNNEPNNMNNESNKQQQQQEEEDQVVVVVEAQKMIEELFSEKLPEQQIKKLLEHAKNHKADLLAMIRNTYDYFQAKKEVCLSAYGAIHHAIENGGWVIPKKPDKPTKQEPKEDKYTQTTTMSEEELAERQARLRAKMKYCDEALSQRMRDEFDPIEYDPFYSEKIGS